MIKQSVKHFSQIFKNLKKDIKDSILDKPINQYMDKLQKEEAASYKKTLNILTKAQGNSIQHKLFNKKLCRYLYRMPQILHPIK